MQIATLSFLQEIYRLTADSACLSRDLSVENVDVQRKGVLTGHRDSVYAIARGPESHQVFSGGGDGMVARWDLRNPDTGELMAQLPSSVYALHYILEGNILIAGSNTKGIHLFDCETRKETRSMKLPVPAIFDITHHINNIIVVAGDGSVTVIDLESWTIKKRIQHSVKSARAISVSAALNEMAVGFSDHQVRIYDLGTFELKHEWAAHSNSVFAVAYTPDQSRLLTGSRDARLKAWNTAGYGLEQEVVAHLYAINDLAFSQDGKHFVTCSLDKSIKVWDTSKLTLLKVIDKARHAGHGTSVNKLLWTSFDDYLVSASDDRTLSLWSLKFFPGSM